MCCQFDVIGSNRSPTWTFKSEILVAVPFLTSTCNQYPDPCARKAHSVGRFFDLQWRWRAGESDIFFTEDVRPFGVIRPVVVFLLELAVFQALRTT